MDFPVDEIVKKIVDELSRRQMLYVTEGEIARRMGVGAKAGRTALQEMRADPLFPPKNIGGKRYWPSVCDFLNRWHDRQVAQPAIAPPQEQWLGQAGVNLDKARKRSSTYTHDHQSAFEKAHAAAPKRGRKADEYWEAYRKSPQNKRTFHKPGWVFILAPDGGNWIEEAKPTDPESWQKDHVPEPRR